MDRSAIEAFVRALGTGARGDRDPYSAYNALIRCLVSFEAAFEHFAVVRQ